MQLIIAEKPSVAQTLASVLGAKKRQDGYIEGNGYLISWCFGHLAELYEPENYDPAYAKWKTADLPIIPAKFQFRVGTDKKKQFALLKKLMERDDVSSIVNACDAGREGEAIFRTVYLLAGCKKPMKRLWISSMEDDAIRAGFDSLRPGSEFDGLYQAAECRNEADWLVGINATRLFSLLYGKTLNVGRVMSPTLALIVQRDSEIKSFQSELYYTVQISCDGVSFASDHFTDKTQAKTLADICDKSPATVTTYEEKEKSEEAPLLYDLTTLQRDANRKLGFTAQQVLDYAQSLYEKKLCTYPRTDSKYLSDDMEPRVAEFVDTAAALLSLPVPAEMNAHRLCNTAKVSDHHAIVPTVNARKSIDISMGERQILELIARRVLCAVSPKYRYLDVSMTVECGGSIFKGHMKKLLDSGWKAYSESKDSEEKYSSLFGTNTAFNPEDVSVKDGRTQPAKQYTEDTILQSMEAAGAKEMPDDAERKGIGTPATRAGIIEKLVSGGFVERRKAKKAVSLIPTQAGISLITVLPEQLQSPLLTAEWEHKLKLIERGELDAEVFMREIADMIRELVASYKPVSNASVLFPSEYEAVGKCPRCGSNVVEKKKGYFCENTNCRFALWKDNAFFVSKKCSLSKKLVSTLLKDKRVFLKGLFSSRTGKKYDATVIMEDDGQRTNFKLDFPTG